MDKDKIKNAAFTALPIVLKLLISILMIVGVVKTSTGGGDFMAASSLLFFTVQSNITIGVTAAVFLVIDIIGIVKKKKIEIPYWLYVVKFAFTVAITLTFLVFWCMLCPQMVSAGQAAYMATASNLCCHTFVPIFALIDWFVYDGAYRNKKYDIFYGTVFPLCYFVFAMICSACNVDFGGGQKVPYFFLNYFELGWFSIGGKGIGVFWWVIVVVLIVLAISWVLMFGKNKIYQKILQKEMKLPTGEVVTKEIDQQGEDDK